MDTDPVQVLASDLPKRPFEVPPGTFISFMEKVSFNDPAARKCRDFYFIQPHFDSTAEKIANEIEKKISIVIMGDGDYRLTSNFCYLLTSLRGAGIKVETLILNDLELDSETIKEILELLKDELGSMLFNRVKLDQTHVEILNNIEMNLHSIAFRYVLPDKQNVFEENKGGKNTTIDLKLVNLGKKIRYLDLSGIPITAEIQKAMEKLDSLQHLILDNLVGSQALDFFEPLLANLNKYPKLDTLSLAGNNLSSIDFSDLFDNADDGKTFSSLRNINFNSTHLSDKHIQDILRLLQPDDPDTINDKLSGLHLSKCHAYERTMRALNNFVRTIPDLQYEAPTLALGARQQNENNQNLLEEDDNHPENEPVIDQVFRNLLEFERNISSFIDESRAQIAPQGLAKICKLNTAHQLLPIILKDAAGIRAFLNASRYDSIDFTRDPKSLIPKNDFNLALRNPDADLDKTLDYADEQSLGEYKIPLINQVHPKRVSDDTYAKEPMEVQREKFRVLMEEMGYESKERKLSDGIEDVFKVLVDDSQHIGWDYKLATFSIIWRPQYHTVSVKFNLSDDWFMERKDRTNVYALRNQDYLIDILSTLNLKPLDFVGELDVLNDGETEVNIRYTIMKYGPLNLAKLLLVAIDKGFIFLRTLQEKNIFDHEDSSSVGEDAKQIRKAVKAELKALAKSKEFIALSRADNI